MNNKTNSSRTESLLKLFDYHSGFFPRALDGISKEDMHNRLNTQANHPAWLAGALVNQRFQMASETGTGLKQNGAELFDNYKGIEAGATYPTNDQYLNDWEKITTEARQALLSIDDKKLDSEINMGGMKMSYYDMICFTIYREASLLGQLALWRRLLDYPAMKYD